MSSVPRGVAWNYSNEPNVPDNSIPLWKLHWGARQPTPPILIERGASQSQIEEIRTHWNKEFRLGIRMHYIGWTVFVLAWLCVLIDPTGWGWIGAVSFAGLGLYLKGIQSKPPPKSRSNRILNPVWMKELGIYAKFEIMYHSVKSDVGDSLEPNSATYKYFFIIFQDAPSLQEKYWEEDEETKAIKLKSMQIRKKKKEEEERANKNIPAVKKNWRPTTGAIGDGTVQITVAQQQTEPTEVHQNPPSYESAVVWNSNRDDNAI